MKAIILAAGASTRMYPVTLKTPKCLLELESGKTIIEHQIDMLKKCGVSNIIVAVGYLKEKIKAVLKTKVRYREFKDFFKYNNLHTLYSIRDELNEDTVVLYSDVVFGEELLRKCIDNKGDFCVLVHNKNIFKDSARVKMVNDSIIDVGNHIAPEESDGNFVGIAKFSKNGAKLLVNEMKKLVKDPKHNNDYYINSLAGIAKKARIGYEFVEDEPWIEIDFLEYYSKAKNEIYPLVK